MIFLICNESMQNRFEFLLFFQCTHRLSAITIVKRNIQPVERNRESFMPWESVSWESVRMKLRVEWLSLSFLKFGIQHHLCCQFWVSAFEHKCQRLTEKMVLYLNYYWYQNRWLSWIDIRFVFFLKINSYQRWTQMVVLKFQLKSRQRSC